MRAKWSCLPLLAIIIAATGSIAFAYAGGGSWETTDGGNAGASSVASSGLGPSGSTSAKSSSSGVGMGTTGIKIAQADTDQVTGNPAAPVPGESSPLPPQIQPLGSSVLTPNTNNTTTLGCNSASSSPGISTGAPTTIDNPTANTDQSTSSSLSGPLGTGGAGC